MNLPHHDRPELSTASNLEAFEFTQLGSKPSTKMVGQPVIGAAGRRCWSARDQSAPDEGRHHAINHSGRAHAEEPRIKISRSMSSAVARWPVWHMVAVRYSSSVVCSWARVRRSSRCQLWTVKVKLLKKWQNDLGETSYASTITEILVEYNNLRPVSQNVVFVEEICQALHR